VIWSFVRPLLAPRTQAKITVLGSNYAPTLLKYIDRDQLPAKYGGTSTRSITDCFGPWEELIGPQTWRTLRDPLPPPPKGLANYMRHMHLPPQGRGDAALQVSRRPAPPRPAPPPPPRAPPPRGGPRRPPPPPLPTRGRARWPQREAGEAQLTMLYYAGRTKEANAMMHEMEEDDWRRLAERVWAAATHYPASAAAWARSLLPAGLASWAGAAGEELPPSAARAEEEGAGGAGARGGGAGVERKRGCLCCCRG